MEISDGDKACPSTEIILIGPMGAGKSALGRLLADHLSLRQRAMDDLRWAYYDETGCDHTVALRIRDAEGLLAFQRYWKPFEAYAVERLLSEHRNCVIDFGAGHSVFEDDDLFARVQEALAPFPYVILLLPSPNLDESIQLLRPYIHDAPPAVFELTEHFVKHHSNHDLAKFVVYTKGKTPEETRDEIVRLVRR